jgi:hypothetical protein
MFVFRLRDLKQIGVRAGIDEFARRACVAGIKTVRRPIFAQEGFGELPGEEPLADAGESDEEVRMSETIACRRSSKPGDD